MDKWISYKKKKKQETLEDGLIYAADFETTIIEQEKRHGILMWTLTINENETFHKITEIKNNKLIINEKIMVISLIKTIEYLSKKKETTVYMHNLGSFDGILIIKALENTKILKNMKILIRNNSIYEIKYKKIKFLDSFKILTASLDSIAQKFLNEEKLKIDMNMFETQESIIKNIETITKYARKDSELLYKIMIKTRKIIWDLFELKLENSKTISTLAFNLFKKNYLEKETIANSNAFNETQESIIRNSYRGGIVDVYIPKGNNLIYYDLNSAYPHAMKNDLPIGLPEWTNPNNLNLNNFFGFLTVKIEVQYNWIPFLGIRNKKILNNIYPYGTFKTCVFSEELKYAMNVNKIKIIKIYSAISFKKGKPLKEYATELYEKRKNSNNVIEKEMYKRLLNHLYGRFGMKNEVDTCEVIEKKDETLYKHLFDATTIAEINNNTRIISYKNENLNENDVNQMEIEIKDKKKIINILKNLERKKKNTQTAPQIAAAITAYARMAIDKEKRKIIKRGGKIYYSDTDSIVTNIEYTQSSTELGRMKIEDKIKEGYFISPKIYSFINKENKIKAKFKGLNIKHKNKEKIHEMLKKKIESDQITQKEIKSSVPIRKDFKNMIIKSIIYIIKPKYTFNKRNKIMNWRGKWTDTRPIEINNDD